VEGKFPLQRRGEPLELPPGLAGGDGPGAADAHLHEERRLFYVGMTRAEDELVLTSAADYGTARTRKLSRFVVEALDLPSPAPPRRSRALEALARHQPAPDTEVLPAGPLPAEETLRLSFRQIDDYETCPLKYKYVHRLRVPLLVHHRIVYGSAVHQAVQEHFRARQLGRPFSEDDLALAFRAAWVSEGFLSREHEEQRRAAGEEALRRFHRDEAARPLRPTGVEKEFAFYLDGDDGTAGTRVQGRYDLVVEEDGRVTILDFKTGAVDDPKKAAERAQKSLQLDIYALAHLRTTARLPDRVELRFLESGLSAGKKPTLDEAARTEERIREVSALIRGGAFEPRPSYMACGQCAFREICPYTARGPEGFE
jgi:DNA helicase-2/ATP-dependent DNA helicase PcrA